MRNRRLLAAWATFLIVGGGLGATLATGLYLISDSFRQSTEERLNDFFGLPTHITRIDPYSFTARLLRGTEIWLPERRARVFDAPRILWDVAGDPTRDDAVLDVYDAEVSVASPEWEKEDYMKVLQACLLHDFEAIGIGQIRLHNARLNLPRDDLRLLAEDVQGRIVFAKDGSAGSADLICHRLNGFLTDEAIQAVVQFDPSAEAFIPFASLLVPEFPLTVFNLENLLQSSVTQGSFSGRITRTEEIGQEQIQLTGRTRNLQLGEWTRHAPGGPIPANLDLEIKELLLDNRRLTRLSVTGEVTRLDADAVLAQLQQSTIGGVVELTLYTARLTGTGIESINVSGNWTGGSLPKLARLTLGQNGATGRFRLQINSLLIKNNELISGDIEFHALPPDGSTGTIERPLLNQILTKHLGVTLPGTLLPERIEYAQMGARLLINRKEIRILSVPGPAGPALITPVILGQQVPLLGNAAISLPSRWLLDKPEALLQKWCPQWEDLFAIPSTSPSMHPLETRP